MKKTTVICLMLCWGLIFLCASAYAESGSEPKTFKVGKAEVWAIADLIREANTSIFDVEPEAYQKYLKSGKAPSAVMTFIVKTGKEIVLIDTGFANEASMLMDGLEKINIKPQDITIVLITHMHGDHIAGLIFEDKPAFPNAKVKIGRIERDFWIDDRSVERFPERQGNFDLAKKVVEICKDAVEVFEFGDEVAPSIRAVDASGHTPGHTLYMLESGGKKVQFIGDMINAAFLQLPRPDISSKYDMDPEKAAQTRQRVLDSAAKNKTDIAGAHIPFPGIGSVKKDNDKGYDFKSK